MGYVEVALIGSVVGGVAAFVLMPAKKCPKCSAALPKVMLPAERKRNGVPLGGTKCSACNTVFDAKSQPIA